MKLDQYGHEIKTIKLSDKFADEDVIRLHNEFKFGLFECDLTDRQSHWLGGVMKGFEKDGMDMLVNRATVDFIANMIELLNEVSQ